LQHELYDEIPCDNGESCDRANLGAIPLCLSRWQNNLDDEDLFPGARSGVEQTIKKNRTNPIEADRLLG
jgi:hypothetical protein